MRNFCVDNVCSFRRIIAKYRPLLSASVNDSTNRAFKNGSAPCISSQPHPCAFFRRGCFVNYQISSAILITSEIKQKLGTNVEKYVHNNFWWTLNTYIFFSWGEFFNTQLQFWYIFLIVLRKIEILYCPNFSPQCHTYYIPIIPKLTHLQK